VAFKDTFVNKKLYPVVGMDSYCPIEANFGSRPFVFDVVAYQRNLLGGEEKVSSDGGSNRSDGGGVGGGGQSRSIYRLGPCIMERIMLCLLSLRRKW